MKQVLDKEARAAIKRMIAAAQLRGDGACCEIMDAFKIRRCPENYLKIIGILAQYRKTVKRIERRRAA